MTESTHALTERVVAALLLSDVTAQRSQLLQLQLLRLDLVAQLPQPLALIGQLLMTQLLLLEELEALLLGRHQLLLLLDDALLPRGHLLQLGQRQVSAAAASAR